MTNDEWTAYKRSWGIAIQRIREEANLSREEVAQKMKVSPEEVVRVEESGDDLLYTTICKVAKALESTPYKIAARADRVEKEILKALNYF